MTFAGRVFLAAGLYGLVVTAPQLLLEAKTSREFPPGITHAEFYYGFVGGVLAWQGAFLLIGFDPARYRPLMLASLIEKLTVTGAVPVLVAQGRASPLLLAFAAVDLILAALFLEAWRRTGAPAIPGPGPEVPETSPAAPGADTEALLVDLGRAMDGADRLP